MSTYRLDIDGSGAEQGSQRIVKSFDDIKAAADRMEGGVVAAAKKASAGFAELQRNARPVSDQAINSLRALSSTLAGFKAPSDAAVRNTVIFLQGIKSVGALNVGRITGLAGLLSALQGYKGPSPSSGKNTLAVLNALRFVSSFSAPRGFASMLGLLSAFKGPSAAAARNVTALLNALNSFKAGPGMAATVRALEKIVAAANAARSSLNSLKGAGPSSVNINTGKAEAGMNRLIKTQGLLQTALLRTQTAWNALGGILAGKAIIGASNDLIKIRAQLEAATGSANQAGVQFDFIRQMANKMGLDFRTAAASFGFFLGSVKGTNLTLKESREIFTGFSVAARALQLSTADVDGVFRALGQMMSKGKIQAEELRGQLGDRLPGAFARFAVALKMTKPGELDQALKKGAISGDRMKQAIIDVAKTLNSEFTPAADKMAKTLDAAFNRMKNAFTFAAGDLGKSGLNDALISLMNLATEFLKSDALNKALHNLGSVLRFLGEHINILVTIMGTLALSSTLKWVAGLVTLQKTMLMVREAMAAQAVANFAMAMSGATVATTGFGRALAVVGAIAKANPWLILAGGVVALMSAMSALNETNQDHLDKVSQSNNSLTTGESIVAAYADKIALNTRNLNAEADAFERATLAGLGHDRYLLSQTNFKVQDAHFFSKSGIVKRPTINGTEIDPRLAQVARGVTDASGQYVPARNASEYKYRITAATNLKRAGVPGADELLRVMQTDVGNAQQISTHKGGRLGYDPNAVLKSLGIGDWESARAQGPGISGTATATGKKTKKHGKSDAEKAADDINAAIDQAMNGITDLETRAAATAESIGKLLSGSFDKAGAAAHIAAVDQEKSFEDAIKGPENKIKGVLQLAKQLGLEVSGKSITEQYQSAKDAVIDYMEARQRAAAEAKKDESVALDILDLRQQNEVTRDYVELLKNRKVSTAAANAEQEIENALIGTSLEKRPQLRAELQKEIAERDALKRSIEATNAARDYENQLAEDKYLAPMYKSGMKQEDIDYYKEMFQYRQKLKDDGWTGNEFRDMVNLHAATLNEARAMKVLTDQYEKAQQTAADMADAIVGGFRDGMEAGDNFLKIFKNIFKQLAKIIMDFVLFNPLKQWLQQALTQTLAPQSAAMGNYGGLPVPGGGTVSSYSTGGGLISSVVSSLLQPQGSVSLLNNNGPAAGGRFTYQNGYLVANTGGGVSTGSDGSIVISAPRVGSQSLLPPIPGASSSAQPVNILQNLGQTLKASQAGFKAFTSFLKTGKGAAAGIAGAIGAAGTAFAMFQTGNQLGKGIAKALGGGFRTQAVAGGILGGAAAGFSLGGPVGAAVGAVVGGVLGFLKKKPKLPSSYGSVVVSDQGIAGAGTAGSYGKATSEAGQQAASGAAKMFNDFALQYGARLAAGNFGTFGTATIKVPGKNNNYQANFYATRGVDRKGQPIGVKGVDWISGTDSQLQAFALIKQFQAGLIKGLSDTLSTVMRNTKATDMEGLQADLAVGQAFDQFVKGSFRITDVSQKIMDLNEAFYKLRQQSVALGLSETKLNKARQKIMDGMKEDFNYSISQGILGFENPALAAYNDLVKEYHDAVETAMAVGGNLADVEKYYGLKRADIIKQWSETANNGLVAAARDLYNQLTASSSSPLNAQTVFGNSRDLYTGLIGQFSSGNFTNVDQLTNFASNYLEAARNLYGSSTDYFDIFKQVTDQLNQYAGGVGVPGSTTTVPTIPDLPSLDSLVQEINSNSLDMIDSMGIVGQAVVEGSTAIVDAIQNLAIALGTQIPTSSPTPTGPTAGGTGVSSTGGTSTTPTNIYTPPSYDYSTFDGGGNTGLRTDYY